MDSSLFTSVITVSSLSRHLPISAVIMHVWIWIFALFWVYHYMRNNTWCETQGWVLGHTEISALQTTSNADPRLLCSLLAGFWNTLLCRHSIATSSKARMIPQGSMWRLVELQLLVTEMLLGSRRWTAEGGSKDRTMPHTRLLSCWLRSGCAQWGFHSSPQDGASRELPPAPLTALRRCCQNQERGVLLFSYLLFFLRPSGWWHFKTTKGKGLDCCVNKEQPIGNLK